MKRASPPIATLRTHNEARCARLLRTARPLVLDDLPWDGVTQAVDRRVVDTLVYMRDVEGFTDRDLVGLAGHRTTLEDPLIGPFLAQWRREEAGHARAIGAFLDRYRAAHRIEIPARQQPPPGGAPWRERTVARVGGPVGRVVTAAHMTWGAANELLTLNGYRLLARRCDHPLLAPLLHRIADQEARHFSFYFLQAQWRLAAHQSARIVLRHVLSSVWTPVGVGDGYKSPDDFSRVLRFLASGADGERVIARMDRRFALLPGCEQLCIYRGAVDRAA